MNLAIGDVIDNKYRIIRVIGEGGMGTVYEGENTRIHRRVAIKLLRTGFAATSDAVQRFEREAQAAGRIGSQHIVEVLDLGVLPDGERYMVMEFLEGEALSDRIAASGGGLSPQVTASLAIQLLEGLRAAHAVGIVHRDLKPENVFVITDKRGRTDFVKIVDFGISKFNTLGNEFSMTRTGAVMGTPYYLSPEQAKGERHVDHRSDLYAVGVIMWEACAGRVPFEAETFNELLFKIVLEPQPPLTQVVPAIDPDFAAIVHKAMARDPVARFQSAEEMQTALIAWYERLTTGSQQFIPLPHLAGRNSVQALIGERAFASTPNHSKATPPGVTHSQTAESWENEAAQKRSKSTQKWMIAAAALVATGAVAAVLVLTGDKESPVEELTPAPTLAPRNVDDSVARPATQHVEEEPETPASVPPAEAAPSATVQDDASPARPAPRPARVSTPSPAPKPAPEPAPTDASSSTPKGRKIRLKL